VSLYWDKLDDEEADFYQIRFKSLNTNDKWKYVNTDDSTNTFTVSGLMASTSYVFQVQSVANDIEGDYSETSDSIETTISLAKKMLTFSHKVSDANPEKYQLLTNENRNARNPHTKTRQLTLGK
jgi:hypothetical protein